MYVCIVEQVCYESSLIVHNLKVYIQIPLVFPFLFLYLRTAAEPIQLETIVVTVAAIVVGLLIILSVMIIICCLRHRNKRLDAETFDLPAIEELDGSPSIKKKSPKSSPKHLNGASAIDYSLNSTELQSYGDEPRRPGSRSPPPADSIINAEQNLTSVTFR